MVADTAAPNPSPPNAQVFAEPIVATSNVILAAPPPPTKLSTIVIVSLIACPVPPLVTTTAYEPLDSTFTVNSCPVPLPVLDPVMPL